MSELGTRLRDARVDKGYTLNTLQQMTKIQKKYLQAIEESNYEEVPGNFYVRAFVKQYADMVGLNGDALLEEFESELEVHPEGLDELEEQAEPALPSRLDKKQGSNEKNAWETVFSYLPVVFLVLIIILIMTTLIIAINRIGSVDQSPTPVESQSSVVSSVEPNSVAQSSEDESEATTPDESTLTDNQIMVGDQVLTLISGDGEETVYELSGSFSDYEFEALGLDFVWVGMYEDEMMMVDQTITADEVVPYESVNTDATSLRIRFGYPEGGLVRVNGTEVPINNDFFQDTIVFVLADGESSETTETAETATETDEAESLEETEEATETEEGFQGPAVLDPTNNSGNE